MTNRILIQSFHSRFSIYEDGKCLIGMKRVAMIPLIAFDVFVNVSSPFPKFFSQAHTSRSISHRFFCCPSGVSALGTIQISAQCLTIIATWSYQNSRTSGVRTVALRTFIGSCATLASSVLWAFNSFQEQPSLLTDLQKPNASRRLKRRALLALSHAV